MRKHESIRMGGTRIYTNRGNTNRYEYKTNLDELRILNKRYTKKTEQQHNPNLIFYYTKLRRFLVIEFSTDKKKGTCVPFCYIIAVAHNICGSALRK